ncbi:MAG: hypothetical protein HFJ44_02830 [Clostridia bacterium]|nr:hypothetical protein [Clostridia bacterium]
MIQNRKKYIAIIIAIGLLLTLIVAQKVYAQYILTREFTIEMTTTPFNLEVSSKQIDIYNWGLDKGKVSTTVVNNNTYDIEGNISINGNILKSFTLAPGASQEMTDLNLTDDTISGLSTGIHNVSVNITKPYSETINNVKINAVGTFTNVEKYGVKVAGTDEDPYSIYAVEDLIIFAQKVNSGTSYSGKTVAQLRSIDFLNDSNYYNPNDTSFGDLNNTPSDSNTLKNEMRMGSGFIGIGVSVDQRPEVERVFSGKYDGRNNEINSIHINSQTAFRRCGIFNCIDGATIQNLGISGKMYVQGDTGGLVGAAKNTCTIKNCHNKTNITATETGYSISGILGVAMKDSNMTILDCSNSGTITSSSSATGIIGFVWQSTVEVVRCYNSGEIRSTGAPSAYSAAAGLIARDNAAGDITISKCYNSGTIRGARNTGGVIGMTQGKLLLIDSYNIGEVIGSEDYTGGLIGWQNSIVSTTIGNCYSAGKITGKEATKGGIIGLRKSDISKAIVTKTYYLADIAPRAISNYEDIYPDMRRTDLISAEFVELIGKSFKYNSAGYPLLNWQ